MDPSYHDFISLLATPLLLFVSAFFSGSETAYFSLDKTTINLLKSDDSKSSKRVEKLLQDPQTLLITILIGNNIVNILIATLTTLVTQHYAVIYNFNPILVGIVNVVFVTFIIMLAGEIFPKIIAVKDSLWFAKKVSYPLTVLNILFTPITMLLKKFTINLTDILKVKLNPNSLTEEELKTLIDISEESGTIQNDEKEMLSSIIEFGETTVKEIMIPRIDMICVKAEHTLQDIISLINTKLHSRIPVYEERIDNIIGIVYAKDLIQFLHSNENVLIKDIMHPVYFVPEQKRIQELLKEFQEKKTHIAIVVDEYGGTSGLVTLEDIIEEIVGEIQDEYDFEEPLFDQMNDYTYILDGRLSIEELNENLPIEIEEQEGIETISGFIHHLTGNLPNELDTIDFENLQFTIQKIDNRRISKIKLQIMSNDPTN